MRKVIFLLSVMILLLTGGVWADDSYNMVWIVIDRVSLDQLHLADTPNLDNLQQKGAFSLMNVRTVGHYYSESTYLSVNTGNRCQGSKTSHIGKSSGKGAQNVKIKDLIRLNSETNYKAKPGLLGDIARENSITIGVLGNSDLKGKKRKTIVAMAMDSDGYVPYAEIGNSILQKTSKPWGYQTDYNQLKTKFMEFKNLVDAIFIETGDLSRIEYYYKLLKNNNTGINTNVEENCDGYNEKNNQRDKFRENSILSDSYQQEKVAALEEVDDFLGFVLENIDLNETQIAVIVPTPTVDSIDKGDRLSWVLFGGRGIGHGWLKSDTTRRRGIITISDLLPVFLAANLNKNSTYKKDNGDNDSLESFDINDVKSIGVKKKVTWDNLKRLNEKVSFIYNIRSPFIKTFILFQIIVIIMAILKIVFKKINEIHIFPYIFEYLLLALLLVPINCMMISLINNFSVLHNIIFLAVLFIGEEILLIRNIKMPFTRILIIAWTIVLLVTFSLFNGYIMLADSILGYSSIIGARYYGIGNEYMGFFIGAFILAITISMEIADIKRYKINSMVIFISFSVITFIVGSGNLGANFGGMLTALMTGGLVIHYILSDRKWINRFMIIFLAILFLIGVIFLDYSGIMGRSSHIGKAFQRLMDKQWQWLLDTIFRKFSMNLKLLRWTIWTRVLLIMIVYLFILIRKPSRELKYIFEKNHYFKAGLYGILGGSLVTMFVNDSGVVAAATILFYPVMSLLYFLHFKDNKLWS